MNRIGDLGCTALLCAIGGSADAIAYLRFGTFVGAMTGNTALLGIDIAEWRPDRAGYHACIIAVFFIAVVMTRTARLSKIPASLALVITAIMLGGSQLIDSEWSAAISAAALGIQDAAVPKIGGVSVNTVFVSGDLVSLGSAVPQASDTTPRKSVALLTTAWVAYAIGAVIGAVALHMMNYPMAVPSILAIIAAIVAMRAKPDALPAD